MEYGLHRVPKRCKSFFLYKKVLLVDVGLEKYMFG